jgi:FkbM family methyltransferase
MTYVRWHSGAWIREGLVGRDNDAWLWVETFNSDEYRLESLGLQDIRLVVDVGASIGVFSAYIHGLYPKARIIAVDPNTRTHELLELNAGEFATIIHGAVFHGGTPALMRGDLDFQATVMTVKEGEGEAIEVVDFQKLISPHCDLLKLDCEHCEYGILLHEDLSRVHYILGEWHGGRKRWLDSVREFQSSHPHWTHRIVRDSENGIFLMTNMDFCL